MASLVQLETFKNIFYVKELRVRVLYTLGLLAVFRIGSFVPVPGVDVIRLKDLLQTGGGFLGLVNLFTGGAFGRFAVFALGIMPYISASIILQLLTVIVPHLEKLSKEGEAGRRTITRYTRYLTGAICVVQAMGLAVWMENQQGIVYNPGIGFKLMTVLSMTAGTIFLMWLGERISERGIGNGISLLIFAGIVADLPSAVAQTFSMLRTGGLNLIVMAFLTVVMLIVIGAIVFVERAQRRVPIQYAKRMVGRRVYSGQSTHLPLKVNTGGVIPVIFASSILMFPPTLQKVEALQKIEWLQGLLMQLDFGMPFYTLVYIAAIIFFCYFYVSIIFNPVDVADNIKKYGGFIPGKRPGKPTAEYIDTVLTRITLGGALYLSAICVLPMFLLGGTNVHLLPIVGPYLEGVLPKFVLTGFGVPFYFGGTSLLIVVGVTMDTVQQIESQLIMRHYEGFLKGSRIGGRRR
jgi:preprotein translocase subunit SecY